jgi:2-hydroxychromene-2-carboxylate isomerase
MSTPENPTDELEFFFDFISPYAYIGWTQIHALGDRYGRAVRASPVLFAALLAHGKTKGPAEIPAKRAYLFKDTLRTARMLGIEFTAPPSHPFNPLLGLRVVSILSEADRQRAIGALYRGVWAGGGGIETEAQVAMLLAGIGLEGEALVARGKEQPAKDALRASTERAIALGVFGVPTVRVGSEIFWGYDSFAHLERYLAGNDPITAADYEAFARVVPTAVRRMGT